MAPHLAQEVIWDCSDIQVAKNCKKMKSLRPQKLSKIHCTSYIDLTLEKQETQDNFSTGNQHKLQLRELSLSQINW